MQVVFCVAPPSCASCATGLAVDSVQFASVQAPAPAPLAATESSSSNVGLIVGIAVGVVAAIAIIAGVAGWLLYTRKKQHYTKTRPTTAKVCAVAQMMQMHVPCACLTTHQPMPSQTPSMHIAPVPPALPRDDAPPPPPPVPSGKSVHAMPATPPHAQQVDRVVVERSPLNSSPFAGSPFSSSAQQSSSVRRW